jgi:hypothetical protein
MTHSFRVSVLLVAALATHAAAQPILIDDFNDGNDDGWTHIDSNDGESWGPGSFDASSGAYRLSTPGVVPTSASCRGCMLSLWDQSSDPFYLDG